MVIFYHVEFKMPVEQLNGGVKVDRRYSGAEFKKYRLGWTLRVFSVRPL